MKQIQSILLSFLLCTSALFGQGVLTSSYDNTRSGWNSNETRLTQSLVLNSGIRLKTIVPVYGDARGVEAKPLILNGLILPDKSKHDVMYLCSMANRTRLVDLYTGEDLWDNYLGVAITSNPQIDFHMTNDHWGCLSTGVIDPIQKIVYQVAWISQDGSGKPESGKYYFFSINLKDGTYAKPPLMIQSLDTSMWKQRTALLLIQNKYVCFGHGSVYEINGGNGGYTGGVTCVDLITYKYVNKFLTAGIWMGSQGLLSDSKGYIYGGTANGDFDPSNDFYGESFLKLKITPNFYSASYFDLSIDDYWTPYTDFQRTGQKQVPSAKLSGVSLPSQTPVGGDMKRMKFDNLTVVSNISQTGKLEIKVIPIMAMGDWSDEDLWSGGGVLIESLNLFCGGGKDGILYCAKMDNLGKTTLNDLQNPKQNCSKLAFPPVWATVYSSFDPCPQDAKTLNGFPDNATAHLHSTPVVMYDPLLKGYSLFIWGENQQLHKWLVTPNGLQYIAQSNEYASIDVRNTFPGGMPGGFISGSSNGDPKLAGTDPNSMLLYASIPYGDANNPRQGKTTQGRLLIYDPIHLDKDGSIKLLWDSQKAGIAYQYNKFMYPTVWNGEIILPNYNGGVMILN